MTKQLELPHSFNPRDNKIFWEKAKRYFAKVLEGIWTIVGAKFSLRELYFELENHYLTDSEMKILLDELDEEYK